MIRIPTRVQPHFEQVTTLDGKQYGLKFDWVQRWGRWTLGIYNAGGAAIVTGLTLQPGYNLASFTDLEGVLFVYDLSGAKTSPGYDDLGPESTFRLYYVSPETERG